MKRSLLICLLVLIVDAISKWWVQGYLPPMQWASLVYPYGGIGVFENFCGIECSLVHVMNRGAAWGLFASMHTFLLVLRILSVGLLGYYVFGGKCKEPVACALILGGAMGNIIDCFVYGHVIDMIHLVFWGYSYPVFNLADSAIVVGACWLILHAWLKRGRLKVA